MLPSPTSHGATSTPISCSPTASTRNVDGDRLTVSLDSSNAGETDNPACDSNDLMNLPVIAGDVTTGTSTRGGKMISMNGFSYLYMSAAKHTIGWRCARRDENCKATIHTSKQTSNARRYDSLDPRLNTIETLFSLNWVNQIIQFK